MKTTLQTRRLATRPCEATEAAEEATEEAEVTEGAEPCEEAIKTANSHQQRSLGQIIRNNE